MKASRTKITRILGAILKLRSKIAYYRALERNYQAALERLQGKEAFNFALFQYNPITTVVVDREGKVAKTNMAKKKSGDRLPNIGDVMYRDYASKHKVDMHAELMKCIAGGSTKTFPELQYEKKILAVTLAPFPEGAIITSQDITSQKQAEADRTKLIGELRRALDEVEQLRGLLPICASCKKIRDDMGYWNQIEVYITKHSQASFSHTICPECMEKHYPELWDKLKEKYGPSGASAS
jgi:hypothetical protein